MTTLLVVEDSEGQRRCDARCYNAREPECDCVCGGRNHGVGLRRALANTAEMFGLDPAVVVQPLLDLGV